MAPTLKLTVDRSCINCDACSDVCPAMAGPAGPAIVRGKHLADPIRINPAACVECGYCVAACPYSFITATRLSMPQEAPSVVIASEGVETAPVSPTEDSAAPVEAVPTPSDESPPRAKAAPKPKQRRTPRKKP